MQVETIELVTLGIAVVVFILMIIAYAKQRMYKDSNFLVSTFIFIYLFVLLNRVFTNIENLFFKELFNLLEHLSILLVAFGFVYLTVRFYKGDVK